MPKEPIKYKYPLLMKGTASGRIVRMTSCGCGTVVGTGHDMHSTRKVGVYSDGWVMKNFKPYKG